MKVHPTWAHLEGKPLTEADLPHGIEIGDIRDLKLKHEGEEAAKRISATAAAAGVREEAEAEAA